jgi:hypothetical protein
MLIQNNKKTFLKLYLSIITFLLTNFSFAQTVVYQDLFRGGVTGGGRDYTMLLGMTNDSIKLQIEDGSNIRKAFLFVTMRFIPDSEILYFNNKEVPLSSGDILGNSFSFKFQNNGVGELNIGVIDVTDIFEIEDTIIHLVLPQMNSLYPNQSISATIFL